MKKLISIALVIIFALSVVPMAYAAEPDVHMHAVSNDCSVTDGEQIVFKPLTKEILGDYERLGGGNYYLEEDIVLDYYLEIYSDANICLNGHTISSNKEYTMGHAYAIFDSQGGTLSICDCKGDGEIVSQNVGVFSRGEGFNMYDIKITARSKGVYISDGGTFNMYGGTIYSEGYGVHTTDGNDILNLYAGVIGGDEEAVESEYGGTVNKLGVKICNDMCHSKGIMKLFWKIVLFFNKLMKKNQECACGAVHY